MMNHDQLALELLVRNGFVKAAEKLVESSSIANAEDKLTEARIYWHIHDMWHSETTNANFGVLPERAATFYDKPGFRAYFNQTTNASLIRDFLALAHHAITVSNGTIDGSDQMGSLSLFDDASMHSALSRTHQEYGIGSLVIMLGNIVERIDFDDEKYREIPLITELRKVVKKGNEFQEKDPPIISNYDPLPPLQEGRLSYWIGRFESMYGHLSDEIFRVKYSQDEQKYLAHKIVHWFGSNNVSRFSALFHFECKNWDTHDRPYDKPTLANSMGKAIEVELDHGSLKRVAFLLEFPEHIVDRTNPGIAGFTKAYDLATCTGERKAPQERKSFMYVCE